MSKKLIISALALAIAAPFGLGATAPATAQPAVARKDAPAKAKPVPASHVVGEELGVVGDRPGVVGEIDSPPAFWDARPRG
jgi:hypothetical protein